MTSSSKYSRKSMIAIYEKVCPRRGSATQVLHWQVYLPILLSENKFLFSQPNHFWSPYYSPWLLVSLHGCLNNFLIDVINQYTLTVCQTSSRSSNTLIYLNSCNAYFLLAWDPRKCLWKSYGSRNPIHPLSSDPLISSQFLWHFHDSLREWSCFPNFVNTYYNVQGRKTNEWLSSWLITNDNLIMRCRFLRVVSKWLDEIWTPCVIS